MDLNKYDNGIKQMQKSYKGARANGKSQNKQINK
jgi:hypothetical protein